MINKISPDFIGDNPDEMEEGTICPEEIPLDKKVFGTKSEPYAEVIHKEDIKEFLKEIIDIHDELEYAEYNDVEKRITKLEELKNKIKQRAGKELLR